jgi:hypothetical protein
MIEIDIINESTVLTYAEIATTVAAIQIQVDRDLPLAWSTPKTNLNVLNGTAPSTTHWWMAIIDTSDVADALGYHTLTSAGLPMGKVFPKSCQEDGVNWTVDLSHEILEILGDPYCNLAAQDDQGTFWARELCDPCEADQSGYKINNVVVSDFVYPDWFVPGATGRMSFCNSITAPFTLASGGYASTFALGAQNWGQVEADKTIPVKIGGRRDSRRTGAKNWKRSTAWS